MNIFGMSGPKMGYGIVLVIVVLNKLILGMHVVYGIILIQQRGAKMEEPIVKLADCCKNCKNTSAVFTFRDAILCNKTNDYRLHSEVCQLFDMDEDAKE